MQFGRAPNTVALAELMQHAFIRDVEDNQRLRAGNTRMAQVAATVPCYLLDYPCRYEQLPGAVDTIHRIIEQDQSPS